MLPPGKVGSADVFFYGHFMDRDLLVAKGLTPSDARLASLPGYELLIGPRAAVVPRPGARVHGTIMRLRLEELAVLYAEPGVRDYEPVPVVVELDDGRSIEAHVYNLAEPPDPAQRNDAYVVEWLRIARKVGLPATYIAEIG